MYLLCHVSSHDHFTEGLCEFMGGNSLCYVTMVKILVTISTMIVEI